MAHIPADQTESIGARMENFLVFFERSATSVDAETAGVPSGAIAGNATIRVFKELVLNGHVVGLLCVDRWSQPKQREQWEHLVRMVAGKHGLTPLICPCEGHHASKWYALNKMSREGNNECMVGT